MKVVAFVPLKINSERVEKKSVRLFGGEPLYWRILNTLLKVPSLDEIYLYCSHEPLRTQVPKGITFLSRPVCLDHNDVRGEAIYDSFCSTVDADIYVLAHATSPFLKSKSIEKGINQIVNYNYESAMSVSLHKGFVWYGGKPITYSPSNIPRTQDIEPIFIETSGFFAFERDLWMKQRRRVADNPFMVEVDQLEAIDIDYPADFSIAETLISLNDRGVLK